MMPKDVKRKCYQILRCVADIKCLSEDVLSWAKMNGCERPARAMLKQLKNGVDIVEMCDAEWNNKERWK